jgi:hypothetical protein
MTDVMRRYVAGRVPDAPLALTSGELLSAVRAVPTLPYDRLQRLLAAVDPVKFAAAPLTPDAARTLGAEARGIVRDEHERAIAAAAVAAAASDRRVAA